MIYDIFCVLIYLYFEISYIGFVVMGIILFIKYPLKDFIWKIGGFNDKL